MSEQPREESEFPVGRLVGGLIVLGLGILMLFDQIDFRWGLDLSRLWPLIVIVVGITKIAGAQSRRKGRAGFLILFMGCWMLINTLHLWGFDWSNSWPLVFFAVGLASIARPCPDQTAIKGVWMIGLGALFLLVTRNIIGLTWSMAGPIALVMVGLAIMFKAFPLQRGSRSENGGSHAPVQ